MRPLLGFSGSVFLVGISLACAPPPTESDEIHTPGLGTDEEAVMTCVSCHTAIGEQRAHLSSHSLLLDCLACHTVSNGEPGPGHAQRGECGTCHSQALHRPGQTCTTCHAPHGSPNLYSVRTSISLPDGDFGPVHYTVPLGADPDGLVRAGVDGVEAGSGLCEICHTTTRYYNRNGSGDSHHSGWCGACHGHRFDWDTDAP